MNVLCSAKNIRKHRIIAGLITILLMVAAMVISPRQNVVSSFLLLMGAVGLYFYMVYQTSEKNFLDLTALFTAVWLATIALSDLKLLSYQKQWQARTWINLTLAVVFMQIGIPMGHIIGKRVASWLKKQGQRKLGRLKWQFNPNKLFWACLLITAGAVLLFIWNVQIKGFIPLFSSRFNAYVLFYTRRMVFVTAACATSPLAYWCIKKGNLSLWKKIALVVCILINTFTIPLLQVNRGVFIVAALLLTAPIVCLSKRKFLALVLCLIVTFGYYEVGSIARNYTDDYLMDVFEPSDITIGEGNKADDATDSTDSTDPSAGDGDYEPSDALHFQLPAKVAFVYGYLTVSHDNFNEAVLHASEYTYGLRQITPFNVILRSDAIEQALSECEIYFVKPNLNTTNLIGSAFYDLREIGVVLFVFIWALCLGVIEKVYLINRDVFSLAVLGGALTPVTMSFFASWFENFTLWMLWGTIFLIMLATCITLQPKTQEE